MYDQYDFPMGRELCNRALVQYIHAMTVEPRPDDLDICIDAILLADALHFNEAITAGDYLMHTAIDIGYREIIKTYSPEITSRNWHR